MLLCVYHRVKMLVDLSAVHVNLLASMSSKAELMVERANG